MLGKVKFFNEAKGFGFIERAGEPDLFVHISACEKEIAKDDKVSFEIEQGKKSLQAANVRKV